MPRSPALSGVVGWPAGLSTTITPLPWKRTTSGASGSGTAGASGCGDLFARDRDRLAGGDRRALRAPSPVDAHVTVFDRALQSRDRQSFGELRRGLVETLAVELRRHHKSLFAHHVAPEPRGLARPSVPHEGVGARSEVPRRSTRAALRCPRAARNGATSSMPPQRACAAPRRIPAAFAVAATIGCGDCTSATSSGTSSWRPSSAATTAASGRRSSSCSRRSRKMARSDVDRVARPAARGPRVRYALSMTEAVRARRRRDRLLRRRQDALELGLERAGRARALAFEIERDGVALLARVRLEVREEPIERRRARRAAREELVIRS